MLSTKDRKIAECKLFMHIDAELRQLMEMATLSVVHSEIYACMNDTGKWEVATPGNERLEAIQKLILARRLEICKAFDVMPEEIGLKISTNGQEKT